MKLSKGLLIPTLAGLILLSGENLIFAQARTGEKPTRRSIREHVPKLPFVNYGLPRTGTARRYAADQVLVRFKPSASSLAIDGTLQLFEIEPLRRIPVVDVYQARIPEGSTVEETIAALRESPYVESAGPNYVARICATPNDTFFDFQYGLYNRGQAIGPPGSPQGSNRADIQATAAWEETKGREDIVIAVIDTGVDLLHPDLQNKIVSGGRDLVNDDFDATDDNGHGTFVAGIAAAETNNGEGIAGVAWNCRILPVKSMDEEGEGYYSWIIDGIVWAVDNGAHVINLSIGGPADDPALEAAVRYAYDNDVVVTASAGNDAEPVLFPAAYTEYVLAVAATDYDDTPVAWSNFGPEIDIAAPGERIISCVPTWYFGAGAIPYAYGSGTSYSCPFVSGFAALLKSLKDWLSADQIMDIIRFSADDVNSDEIPGQDDYIGYGRINMETALIPIKLK